MFDQETDDEAAQSTLTTMVDAWAKAVDLPVALSHILSRDDHVRRLESFIKLVWSEGALAGYARLSLPEIVASARGLRPN
jgi:hypothetical protein